MRTLLIPLLLAAGAAAADVTGPDGRTIECYCTDSQGERVELGQLMCLEVDGRSFMALCDMSLNNPIWRDTGEGCVAARMTPIPMDTVATSG